MLGGTVGYFAFRLAEREGYFAIALVGACIALGAGFFARRRHLGWGLAVGVLAVAATAVVEWQHSYRADETFWSFVAHFGSLSTKSKLSYLAVGLAGVWFGSGRDRRPSATGGRPQG